MNRIAQLVKSTTYQVEVPASVAGPVEIFNFK